jgi:16S rRNA (uracil1498-N3)-methyltransferase
LAIAPSQLSGNQISLTLEQQHYLRRVLRLQPGAHFIALNGQGQGWLAEIVEEPTKARILEAIAMQTELPVAVTLIVAVPKGNGMDDIVRQATELGVATILPMISDRTLMHPSPQKLARWRRIAQEATEQSERQVIPDLSNPIPWVKALNHWNQTNSTCYLCTARGDRPHLLTCLQTDQKPPNLSSPSSLPPSPLTIATGPEGGWTELEIEQAIAAGYQPVSLGHRILRAVTAPIVALSLVAAVLE